MPSSQIIEVYLHWSGHWWLAKLLSVFQRWTDTVHGSYLVPSSRIRPLVRAVAAPLHPFLSLASRLMLLMVAPLEYPLSVSNHICLGLPLLLAPFILPSSTSYSIPHSLTTCLSSLCHSLLQCPLRFDVLDDRYVCLSLHPRYSQYSSPTPQLESVDLPSLMFSHRPSLRSV